MQELVDDGRLAWSLHWNVVPEGVATTPNDRRWEVREKCRFFFVFWIKVPSIK